MWRTEREKEKMGKREILLPSPLCINKPWTDYPLPPQPLLQQSVNINERWCLNTWELAVKSLVGARHLNIGVWISCAPKTARKIPSSSFFIPLNMRDTKLQSGVDQRECFTQAFDIDWMLSVPMLQSCCPQSDPPPLLPLPSNPCILLAYQS